MRGVLLIMQSGGSSPVINATLAGALAEAQRHNCFHAVYGARHGVEGVLSETLIDLSREIDLNALARTPAAALGASRHKLRDEDYERLFAALRAHNVRFVLQIGGNGSMFVCHRIAQAAEALSYPLLVAGAPKTIDNDIAGTDHSPGYGSAARFLALAARDTGRDLEAMATFDSVSILEAMGRDAGWLAASSALLRHEPEDAPHLVYVPEIPFEEDRFLEAVSAVYSCLGRVFVVIAEGLRDAVGVPIGQEANVAVDSMGRPIFTLGAGVSAYLARRVRERLSLQARTLRPGLIGRALSACLSESDVSEAWQVGVEAVRHLAQDRTDFMVTLERLSSAPYLVRTGTIPLEQVFNREKRLPRAYMNEAGTMVTSEFISYAAPLIGETPPPLVRLPPRSIPKKLF
ncbi:MAG: diphosphate--fructose-6-phosphate 1-phosphotransferase [Anaerolineae bacterium]|nr:diphosphate--fructose-6-phosphate 1-phosphotransferase [Anaerolineae bacterium]